MLTAGTKLGPYEIVAPIGAGGMGEVYKGRDTRLDRSVAIKVLAPEIAGDPDLRARFEHEARAVAALDHPHICGICDVGEANGTHFIVMPHLDGQTLAARLEKGPLPLDHVLKIATEVADALDKAHRQGITHRDLKPANIMLTKAGSKLLDFGLAKLKAPAGPISMSGMTRLATPTPFDRAQGGPNTAHGTILGTVQYMAPEQVEGREADSRSDIWALGAVIFEMATGTRPFKGDTPASVIGSILKDDPPPISARQPLASPLVDHLVSRCFAKDPNERWQTAADLTRELQWTAERATRAPGAAAHKPAGRRSTFALAVAGVLLAVMMPMLFRHLRETPMQPKTIRFSVLPPEKRTFTATNATVPSTQLAVSPDGQSLAFIASVAGRRPTLWIRTLDELSAREIAGTEDASYPFWSPDSRFVAFFAKNKLNKVAVAGGAPQQLCDAGAGRGGTWNRDDVIVFALLSAGGVLMRVSATGGTPVAVTALSVERQETGHRFPWFLPDGRHFLLSVRSRQGENRGVSIGSLDSSETTHLLTTNARAVYDSAGFLIFTTQGILMAQAFDTQRLALSGDPFQIAPHVDRSTTEYAPFGVSDNGVLTYASGTAAGTGELRWFDRTGKALGAVGSPGDYVSIQLSPDQQRVAVSLVDPQPNTPDLWLMDLRRGTTARFTSDTRTDAGAVWSPDGNRIVFRSDRGGNNDLYIKPLNGGEAEDLILGSAVNKLPTDWSSDGTSVVYHTIEGSNGNALWTIATSTRTPKLFLSTPFNEMQGRLSPDGRWMAYTSDESGALEVHVQPFPSGGQKSVISTGGGSEPSWRRDGRELFYLAADRKIMAVPIEAGATFRAGAPHALFEARVGTINPEFRNQYTVTADGQRFLVNTIQEGSGLSPITVVLNWTAGFKK